MPRTQARTAEIPLTEAEIDALSRLLAQAIIDTGSNRKARIFRAILLKLDSAAPTEELIDATEV